MTDQSARASTIIVDDLLHSFDRLIDREREKTKRTILAKVEIKINSSFDRMRFNLINHMYDAMGSDESDAMPNPNEASSSSTIKSENIEMIEIEDSDEENLANEQPASATIPTTTSPTSSLPIEMTECPLLPSEYQIKYPILIKKFDTYEEANVYRIEDNFRFPKRHQLKDGLLVCYKCYQYFNCPARIAIWKSKAKKTCLVFSSDEPHSHDRAAAKSKINPEIQREIECLFKQRIRAARKVFELLCAKFGKKAVNGFEVIRCIETLRSQKYRN